MMDRDLAVWFDEAKGDGNPYLSEWFAVACLEEQRRQLFRADVNAWKAATLAAWKNGTSEYSARHALVGRYAWAVPCEGALRTLADLSPLVEVGAGTGYWAWLLRKRGVDVLACDLNPPPADANHWHRTNEPWTKVERGGPDILSGTNGRTLFLCWPPYNQPVAADCLSRYHGDRLVYVGEQRGGCNGDDPFFERLEAEWSEERDVDLPQWDGIHDFMTVYNRRRS